MSDQKFAELRVGKALAEIRDAGFDTSTITNNAYWSDQPVYSSIISFGAAGSGNDFVWRDSPYGGSVSGLDGNDILMGGSNADHFFGGAGNNTVSYVNAATHIGASLDPSIHLQINNNAAVGDTYDKIQNLVGSRFDDYMIGDAGNNQLYGWSGNDTLEGGDGFDKLYGGDGDDTLYAGKISGTDTLGALNGLLHEELHGGEGKDRLVAGINSDILDGGGNLPGQGDTVDYSSSKSGVTVNLATGHGSGGYAAGDTYTGIENIDGSYHDDRLIGDGNDNVIQGVFGNDTMTGGGGSDTFRYFPADVDGFPGVNYGNDVITDFQATGPGQDHIQFEGAPTNLATHLSVVQHGVDTQITGDFFTGSITLQNVHAADVHF